MKIDSLLYKVLYIILLYCMLYTAPFVISGFHYNGFLILRFITIIYVIINIKEFSRFCRLFSKEIKIMILISFYSIFRTACGGDIALGLSDVSGLFALIVMPFFFISFGKRIGIESTDELVRMLLIATTLAVTTSIMALFSPPVNSFIRNNLIQLSEDEYIMMNDYRGFGWGGQLTSEYAYIIALVSIVGLLYLKRARWYLFVFPFAMLAVLINARTGFVVALFGLIAYFMKSGKLWASVAVLIVGYLGYIYIIDILGFLLGTSNQTYIWVTGFLNDTSSYARGDVSSGALNVLMNDMVWFPDSIKGWLFGDGITLFLGRVVNGRHMNSDIGFINQLFTGGLIYCAILYYLVGLVCIRLKKRNQKALSLFVFFAFLIVNTKGSFVFNTYIFGTIMILYYGVYILGCQQNPYPAHPIKFRVNRLRK